MDRIADLSLFLRVLDLGSISAAARSLDVSVAVASQRLKRLERELGVRLIHRTTRQLHATPEGLALAAGGRALADEFEALTSGLRQAAVHVTGTLKVTMPASFGRQYVSPQLPAFLLRHPRLTISVNLDDEVLDLVRSGFDLGIRVGTLGDSRLAARKLANNRRVLCASPTYLARYGRPKKPQDLNKHECLLLVGSSGRQDVWRFGDRQGGEIVQRVHGRFESNTGELLRDAACAGLGVAMHSTWHIHGELRSGTLERVLPDYAIADTGIYAVMPQRRLAPPRVRAFVDFLAESLGGNPPWEN
jgi:DNA-binding transcriptional LysR family regulator